MKIDYIIPTLNRPTLKKTIKSIENENIDHNILICDSEKSAGENRNKCLKQVNNSDWIIFVDDDDYLKKGHSLELDNNFDIVILKMEQEGKVKPDINKKGTGKYSKSCLFMGNVGINFAIKTSIYLKYNYKFDTYGLGEDWRFLEMFIQKTNKIKITNQVYYIAPTSEHTKNKKMDYKLKNQKFGLYIATPIFNDEVKVSYMDSILNLSSELAKAGIPSIRQHIMNTSLITKARNECLSNWMNTTKLDYFLFIDADIGFNALDVIKLMNYDKPLVAGTYPKKHLDWQEIQNCLYNDVPESSKELFEKTSQYTIYDLKENKRCRETNLLEVERVGTGFMMIKRELIQKLAKKYKKLIYKENGKKGYGMFETMIKNKELISEDYSFCERVREIGEKVYVDTDIQLTHTGGNIKFYGNYQKYLDYANKK